jgi:prophage regulatory protein
MSAKILRFPALVATIGLSKSTIKRFVAAGAFPKPIPLGPRAVGFIASEVDAWIEQRGKEDRQAA